MTNRKLLITGATGNQGGATINELLNRPSQWRLQALVRSPTSEKAQALAARSIELVEGDLDKPETLQAALVGVYGVLSVQTPMGQGPQGEERQGKQLASLAAEAGVKHFIYCSAGGVERNSGVPHFESKRAIEDHIKALALPATILRPAAFMEMFDGFAFRTTMLSMMKTYLRSDRAMQMVSTRDVGWLAAEAFDKPEIYLGEAIAIAGDSITRGQAIATLRKAGKRPVLSFTFPPVLRKRLPEDFRLMFEWIAREGFNADLRALRKIHPGMLSLASWSNLPS